jgi:hypothetical protein
VNVVRLADDQLVELAELVADAIAARVRGAAASQPTLRLVDAQAVADRYGVERSWVYAHADELGAVRLGDGPRGRLRFDLEEAGRRLTACSAGRESDRSEPAKSQGSARRRRPGSGTSVPLLPIRGGS